MPVYEYKCTNEECNHKWDLEQKMTDDKITECPKCKKETAKRLISMGTTFHCKGPGWFNSGGY